MSNLIPVLDVLNGQVVRAVGGRRSEYRPIRSSLTNSCNPITVARVMIAATRADTIYVADLDGIISGTPSKALVAELAELPVRVLLDSGVRTEVEMMPSSRMVPVLGTETLTGPEVLAKVEAHKIVLSVDLFEGRLLGNGAAWGVASACDVMGLLKTARGCRIGEAILLDLARVGEGGGTGTESLLREAVARFPEVGFHVGGGIRGMSDVQGLIDAGAKGVLVSSAIHAGVI